MPPDPPSSSLARRQFLKCSAWAGTGLLWSVSGGLAASAPLQAAAASASAFSFVQVSDSHIGFNKDPNPDARDTFREAVAAIRGLKTRPAFILHTGDVSQLSRPQEFDDADQILKEAGLPVFHVPGEHDMLDEGQGQAFLDRYGQGTLGDGWYSFDHGGVHFVGLVNVKQLQPGGMGHLGPDQIAWLQKDLAGRPASQPIVVFTHIPLWTVYEPWGWGTDDAGQALSLLARFGSVTVLNGHIHQVLQKVEGHVAFHTADSGFVVLLPLAGVAFAACGRHPIAGIAAAFAGTVGAFAGNPLPGQFDALILGLSEPAARLIDAHWTANLAGNWYFTATAAALFVPIGWWVTETIIEPKLGPWAPIAGDVPHDAPLTDLERKGLRWAGLAALAVVLLWAGLVLIPPAPLLDPEKTGAASWTPFFRSLVAGFFFLFLASGCAFGLAVGTIKTDRDIVRLASESMAAMSPYIVLALAAAHFILMFTLSNLGVIIAIDGADLLKASGLPIPIFLMGVVVLTAVLDMFIGSASAKWAALAPIIVPMLMLVGVSPEMSTAAYRMGDSTVNFASPLMPYFALVLGFCQRWRPNFGVGGLISTMLPYSAAFLVIAMALTGAWSALQIPTGPGAPTHYLAPASTGAKVPG